jgi:hypothetical protein
MSDGGKGDSPRPLSVDQKTFASNWDAIFGKKKKTEEEKFDEKVVMQDEYYDESQGPADSIQGG